MIFCGYWTEKYCWKGAGLKKATLIGCNKDHCYGVEMKIDDAVETLAHFFNDFIGAWIPGLVMAAGFIVMHMGDEVFVSIIGAMDKSAIVWFLAAIFFALGHLISAFYQIILKDILKWLKISKGFDESQAQKQQSYKTFLEIVNKWHVYNETDSWGYHDLRNIALSISQEASALGRRFMFISLLCSGVGTVLTIFIIDFSICLFFFPELLHHYRVALHWLVQVVILCVSAWCLFKQSDVFYKRAMTMPFSVAITEVKLKEFKKDEIK
ncbi:TPA: hypothetical protein PXJ62_000727 [Yersinia enterocolitica]|nr:hypothetical protein [Yersinia enterocolitica]CNG92492.1 Uncharacterised protein [Yersinia frederiksenii]EKN3442925.1 hypothetical protein [Yersinia enterocolitica]EKN4796241.1 hypothetical protein [Yersinia enterocolitica]EKN5106731.1 hypothetical protein [Yersinia enterocolitica]